jgi:hypothetical protein
MNFYLVPSGKPDPVMAGLVPAIHGFKLLMSLKTWMVGPSPTMTRRVRPSRRRKIFHVSRGPLSFHTVWKADHPRLAVLVARKPWMVGLRRPRRY